MNFEKYLGQVKLLIRVLPIVLKDERFALKGGTAINLFYRNLPRLSVNIDLVYLPLEDRMTSYKNIHNILEKIKIDLNKHFNISGFKVTASKNFDGKSETKLFVSLNEAMIKIEPNYSLRGVLGKTVEQKLCLKASELTALETIARCSSFEDIYAGKTCATLDRQHSRDLFDIKNLFDNEGITTKIKNAFIFYLASSNRPFIELLNPNLISIDNSFNEEFFGMHEVTISKEDLEKVRECLIKDLNKKLDLKDKLFIVSLAKGIPDWSTSPIENIGEYPSIKWKLFDINKMDKDKKIVAVKKLEKYFSM